MSSDVTFSSQPVLIQVPSDNRINPYTTSERIFMIATMVFGYYMTVSAVWKPDFSYSYSKIIKTLIFAHGSMTATGIIAIFICKKIRNKILIKTF